MKSRSITHIVTTAGMLTAFFMPVCAVNAVTFSVHSSNQDKPRAKYNCASTTLKGYARKGAVEYRWDFGDGTYTGWIPVVDPRKVGAPHTYKGAVGQLFIAQLIMRKSDGTTTHDEYLIKLNENMCLPDMIRYSDGGHQTWKMKTMRPEMYVIQYGPFPPNVGNPLASLPASATKLHRK